MSQLRKWTRRLAATGLLAPVLVATAEAQSSPPADTVPMFAFAIDPAAVAAGLGPLRRTTLSPGEREVRVWTGFGLGIPHTLYRMHTLGGDVRGDMILWWNHDGEWRPTANRESMHAYVARAFACGRIRRHEIVDACDANLDRHPPDWRHALAEIDSLGVGILRSPYQHPQGVDGYHMVVETRGGAGYRTAYFDMSSATGPGDTPRASAILEVLQQIREAVMRDSTSKRR